MKRLTRRGFIRIVGISAVGATIIPRFISCGDSNDYSDSPDSPDPEINSQLFTFFNKNKFFKFVSYFDAMRAKYLETDLDYLKSKGVDGIRIMVNFDWYNWTSINNDHTIMFDSAGNLNQSKVLALKNVLHKAQDRGLIVDISFISYPIGINETALRTGIVNLLTIIQGWGFPNIMFDLANEHHKISQATATQLAQDMRNIFGPDRYYYGISIANNQSPEYAYEIQINTEGCNTVRYHDPRVAGWSDATAGLATRLKDFAGDIPVYFDEPTARGYNDECEKNASDFINACKKAKDVGVAAWCFHTYTGFILHDRTFQSVLDGEEVQVMNQIGGI